MLEVFSIALSDFKGGYLPVEGPGYCRLGHMLHREETDWPMGWPAEPGAAVSLS